MFIKYLLREKKKNDALLYFKQIQVSLQEASKAKAFATRNSENDLKFDPPVYRQRYDTVYNVLINENWRKEIKKIVEFGCAEMHLYIYLKHLIALEELCFVDIDEDLLQENLFRVQPLTIEYLKRRSRPFVAKIFAGSIADPDHRILDSDAVIGIEIIEHLFPDVLEAVPYTVFHCIRPKLAIFTTPNADFNILFLKDRKFRHIDHKFEWTREQFESWANNITMRFPSYFVIFQGIGCGPIGTEKYGCCSQMAVFVRRDVVDVSFAVPQIRCFCSGDMQHCDVSPRTENSHFKTPRCSNCYLKESFGICKYLSYSEHFREMERVEKCLVNPTERDPRNLIYYKLVEQIDYPYEIDERTPEQKILDELKWKIINLGSANGRYFQSERLRSEVPVEELTYNSNGKFISILEVVKLLSSNGYCIESCPLENDEERLCVIYEPVMEDSESTESDGYESGNSRFVTEFDGDNSDWDTWDIPSESAVLEKQPNESAAQNNFPEWLLQILDTSTESNNNKPEPHFHCQGDGIGVHSSVLNYVDEDVSLSTLSSLTTNGTAHFAETALENSELDALSIPYDNAPSADQKVVEKIDEETAGEITLSEIIFANLMPNRTINRTNMTVSIDDGDEYFDSNDKTS